MKKKIFIMILCVIALCGCGKVSKLQNGNDAVVSFKNGKKISVDDLYTELKNSYGVYKLVEIVDDYVLHKEYGNEITDDMKTYAENQISYIKNYYPDEKDYLNYIQSNFGVANEDEFKDYIYINYLRNKSVEDYAEKQITDDAIEDYYNKKVVGDIKVSHILITPDKNDDMTDEEITKAENKAKKKAEKLIKKLQESKDVTKTFAKLAKENSDDSGTKEDGGNVGYFNKIGDKTMVSEFTEAAYALKDNEFTTEPVKSEYGYHIILRTGSKEKATLKKLKKDIKKVLTEEFKNSTKTIQVDAMTELRKKYDMSIEDSELEKQYGNYIQYLISQVESNTQE